MLKNIDWNVIAQEGEARAGILRTRRSVIETPVFMPVGTQGTVKGVRYEWLESELDARIILGNTYHLFLRPGAEIIRELGGLHRFSTWNRSLLTDSGGFQVFSLTDLRKLTEEGVEFRSHIDGSKKFLSPEVSMEVQAALGAEIVMVFDECPPGDAGFDKTKKSLEMTARWAKRSKDKFNQLQNEGADTGFLSQVPSSKSQDLGEPLNGLETWDLEPGTQLSGQQALFGIVQGAGHLPLRRESLDLTTEIGFDGYAIGGLSVGEEKAVMYEVLEFLAPQMPKDAPRYLMGVGTPEDLIEAVYRGVDMFDCVMPTRNGRTGGAFTSRGKLNIRNAKFARDPEPLDAECPCSVCRRYSRAYLRHLYQTGEMLAAILISHHNLAFFLDLMRKVRDSIKLGSFSRFRKEFLEKLQENTEADV
ncbi:MAG TPA: tRNA guanosine(34) transglycosylase Tgt [Pyrinomonadaceae bacterium]|jgi:queuine tRNA-ribosyltransferase|nr:tRNA guanosine(34) transglycosylase Tgt [Pyrinomonadaceae bacterium]